MSLSLSSLRCVDAFEYVGVYGLNVDTDELWGIEPEISSRGVSMLFRCGLNWSLWGLNWRLWGICLIFPSSNTMT